MIAVSIGRYLAIIAALCSPTLGFTQPTQHPYPLCPGEWDSPHSPVSRLQQSIFDPVLVAQRGPDIYHRERKIDAPRPTVSSPLPRKLEALTVHQDLAVRNEIQDLKWNLQKSHTPAQQQQVDAALSGLLTQESLAQLPAQELAQKIKAVSARAKVASMIGVVDPRAIEGYFGGPPETLTTQELLKVAKEPELKALSLQVAALNKLGGNEVIQMIGVGEGSRPGGLGAVPAGRGEVAWGRTATGQLCLRPAEPADYKLDPGTKRNKRAWDPAGFRDVGMILWREISETGIAGEIDLCSFVRLSAEYAITAAHCAITTGAGQPISKRLFGSERIEAIALLPKLDGSTQSPKGCFSNPENCGYLVLPVKSPARLPHSLSWPSASKAPVPDIALLSLPFGTAPAVRSAISKTTMTNRLTLAGYGRTDAANAFKLGTLLVGWQAKPPSTTGAELVWSVNLQDGAATGCKGDSGGAVFDGDLSGLSWEQPVLAGVVSWAEYKKEDLPSDPIERCAASSSGHAVRLDAHYEWLCDTSKGAIRGCQAP